MGTPFLNIMDERRENASADIINFIPVIWFSAQPCFQTEYLFFNPLDGFYKFLIRFPGWVIQTPILPPFTGQKGALYIAAHGDHYIHGRNIRKQFAVLTLSFHINMIQRFHQPHRVRIDVVFPLRTGGIAFKYICRKMSSQRLGNLASAGIVDTDECNLLHTLTPACAAASPHRQLSEPCPWIQPDH